MPGVDSARAAQAPPPRGEIRSHSEPDTAEERTNEQGQTENERRKRIPRRNFRKCLLIWQLPCLPPVPLPVPPWWIGLPPMRGGS